MSNIFNTAVGQMVASQKRSGSPLDNLASFFPFNFTSAGKKVSTNASLTISAFYCALNTIANSIALLPTSVFQDLDGKRNRYTQHPADYLLYREPNSKMTAFNFKFIMVVAMFMRGNAFALIQRNNAGRIVAFHYLDPDKVEILENNDKLYYKYNNTIYSAYEILHVPGFSFDGVSGKSIVQYAADNLGVTLAAQKFGGDSYVDRGISQGVLESDLSLKKEKKVEISNAFSDALSSGNKHRAPLLDEGMKYKPITLRPDEAKFIETEAKGVADIARWFGIPLHKLHVEGEGGYNFMVQMSIEYLQTAVMPIGEKFKQEFERKIFTQTERTKGVYIHHNYKKLLQADPKARAQYYKDMVFVKAMNPNEIRELEDMNPYEGGDQFLQMSNLQNDEQIKNQLDG